MIIAITTCFSFLRIKHKKIIHYQWTIPFIFSVIMVFCFWHLPIKPELFGNNGLVKGVNNLLGILIGFYIASIAAVASFNKESLDNVMAGTPPIIINKINGRVEEEPLTRRRFFCIVFGYCAFLSIFIYMLGLISTIMIPSLKALFVYFPSSIELSESIFYAKIIWLFVYLLCLSSLMSATLIGLYYLVDRIHRE